MKLSARTVIACLSLFLIATACSKPTEISVTPPANNDGAPSPTRRVTSELVVKASAEPVIINAGGSTDAVVRLTIDSGYHVNANPPTFPYLIATELNVVAADGISALSVSYPKALTKNFAFADKPLAVYEGNAELIAKMKADIAATSGEHSVAAQLRVQACDDLVCYPPGRIELRIPVTVK